MKNNTDNRMNANVKSLIQLVLNHIYVDASLCDGLTVSIAKLQDFKTLYEEIKNDTKDELLLAKTQDIVHELGSEYQLSFALQLNKSNPLALLTIQYKGYNIDDLEGFLQNHKEFNIQETKMTADDFPF